MKTITIYHIFTNNNDEWLSDKKEALALFNEWKKEFGTARLYVEIWEADKSGKKVSPDCDSPLSEDCLKHFGAWPL